MTGEELASLISHVLGCNKSIDISLSGMKLRIAHIQQPLLDVSKLVVAALWIGECFNGIV